MAWKTLLGAGVRPAFPPSVAIELVKRACELPEVFRRSLSLWTCAELARSLVRDGIVDEISPQTVQRILESNKLKPWRVHHWLSPKVERDEEFYQKVLTIRDLYTRPLGENERVLSVDEKTSMQPRTRSAATKPAKAGNVPVRLEHEYKRKGATNLFAALDTRTGKVTAITRKRKRQIEFIELLEKIDATTPEHVTAIHIICDNVSIHHGKLVKAWVERHTRFCFVFTPVHCSWMNQVEQWFSILQRKRLVAPNFADVVELERKVEQFIAEWNEVAGPFKWTENSFDKVLAKCTRSTPTLAAA
jgi:hypothetical protein